MSRRQRDWFLAGWAVVIICALWCLVTLAFTVTTSHPLDPMYQFYALGVCAAALFAYLTGAYVATSWRQITRRHR